MLETKMVSPSELRLLFLERIAQSNPKLNCYLDVYNEPLDAVEPTGPLANIPAIIKDNILVKGHRATAGSNILKNYVASYDATVVDKLKKAGTDILGKGNMDEFAMGTTGEYSAFGPTLNPHDTQRVAGGSSSGPVAAVAAGLAVFGLGSDTGGSIRMPSSLCGVVGLKPTYGRVSRSGLMAMASSLDQIGTITRTIEDAAEVLSVIAGNDEMDSTSSSIAVPDFKASIGTSIKGLRIGVPKEFFGEGLDPQIKQAVERTIQKLESIGAKIGEVSLPLTEYALPVYYVIVPCEISANLARYDGIRYGFSDQHGSRNLLDVYLNSRSGGFGPEVRRRILIGTYALSAGYFDAYYLKAQKVRNLIIRQFADIFKEYDLIAGPASPVLAPKLGEFDNPLAFYLADVYTVQVNLAGLPALSMPCGMGVVDGKKLPIGLQLIANHFQEEKLFQAGHALEQDLNL